MPDTSLQVKYAVAAYAKRLTLYPSSFLREYRSEMLQTFADAAQDTYRTGGRWALTIFSLRSTFNTLMRANAEHAAVLASDGLVFANGPRGRVLPLATVSSLILAILIAYGAWHTYTNGIVLSYFLGGASIVASRVIWLVAASVVTTAIFAYALSRRLAQALTLASAVALFSLPLITLLQGLILRHSDSLIGYHGLSNEVVVQVAYIAINIVWVLPVLIGQLVLSELARKRLAIVWAWLSVPVSNRLAWRRAGKAIVVFGILALICLLILRFDLPALLHRPASSYLGLNTVHTDASLDVVAATPPGTLSFILVSCLMGIGAALGYGALAPRKGR